jgi:hypothetical protein
MLDLAVAYSKRRLNWGFANGRVGFDNVFGVGVGSHAHDTVADDYFKDIGRDSVSVKDTDFLLEREGDFHGRVPLG